MAGIDDLIAQGPGRRDFSPLGEVFGAYRDGLKARREEEIAQTRQSLGHVLGADGQPDYGAAALHLLRGGDIGGATALARLAIISAARGAAAGRPKRAPAQSQADDTGGVAAEDESESPGFAPASAAAPPASATAQPPLALPQLRTRDEVEDALAQARAARAAGRDPGLVLKRLRDLGIGVSNY